MSEEAKAVQEVAKTAGKAIEASQEVGAFCNRIFGGLIENSVGLLADKLQYYRAEKLILLHEKTKQRLNDKGIGKTHPVLPKIGIPLIEQATIEENDDLHSKWANMLSNAMDPSYIDPIKRSYVSILTDMEPLDVLILDLIFKEYTKVGTRDVLYWKKRIAQTLSHSIDACEISLNNLIRLGCIEPGVVNLKLNSSGGITFQSGGHDLSSYKGTEMVRLTLLGIEFAKAVN